jgi:DNA-binding MarR family transcriptional regulator
VTHTPRTTVIAETWLELGSGVRPLSTAAGLPLARTVKLVLDPLVIRPAQRPHLGHALLADDAAEELRERIRAAGDDLAATAAWFTMMKTRRRARKITSGSPQDLYFQKAYELARTAGEPAEAAADAALDEVHDPGRMTAADLREYLAATAARVREAIDDAWGDTMDGTGEDPDLAELADELAMEPATLSPLLKRLEAQGRVVRERNPADERALAIGLTPEGRRLRARALSVPGEIMARTGMAIDDVVALRDALGRFAGRRSDSP